MSQGTKRSYNPWLDHVKTYRRDNPDLSFKEVLSQAKSTYTKKIKVVKEKKPHPWLEHLSRLKAEDPEWKTKMSYQDFLKYAKTCYVSVDTEMEGKPELSRLDELRARNIVKV